MTVNKENFKPVSPGGNSVDTSGLADRKHDEPDTDPEHMRPRRYSRAHEVLDASSSRQWAWMKD
ncbi:MAG: hypothetical protein ABI451_12330 [Dokdonella sp.]